MKTWKIFWGLGFVLAAVLIILDTLDIISPLVGFMGEVSIFAIIVGLLLFAFIIARLIKGRIAEIFFPLAFIFMLFEKNIANLAGLEEENIINNWLVILIALLLSIGFSILFSSHKVNHGNHGGTIEINGNYAESNLGSSTIYVDCDTFTPSCIENSLGSCSVHFENPQNYKGDKTLHVENNLGSMVINVPGHWIVKSNIENNLGGSHVARNNDEVGPVLYINGENNLGSLTIRYV
ncbi:MAG: hypothetical protein IJY39_00360 [Clostridia bacterium]|nr:hypothetical protein [Clostridia bacterium]